MTYIPCYFRLETELIYDKFSYYICSHHDYYYHILINKAMMLFFIVMMTPCYMRMISDVFALTLVTLKQDVTVLLNHILVLFN